MTGGPFSEHHRMLRAAAERHLARHEPQTNWDDWDLAALIHELGVHQIELELQNSELQRAVAELEREHAHYHTLYDRAPTAYFSLNAHGEIMNVNQAGVQLLDTTPHHLLRRRFAQFLIPAQRTAFADLLDTRSQSPFSAPQAFTVLRRDGEELDVQLQGLVMPAPAPEQPSWLITLMDVTPLTQARAQLEHLNTTLERRIEDSTRQLRDLSARLRHQALHDHLTGLPNRAAFAGELQHALEGLRRTGQAFAVLYCDLDHFKAINDRFGHPGGDEVLVALAHRLHAVTRPADHLARLGGDEFAMLLLDVDDVAVVSGVVTRLETALREPMVLAGEALSLTISTGVLMVPGGYDLPEEIMRDVDLALYQAKHAGRDGAAVFQPSMRSAGSHGHTPDEEP